MLQQKSIACQLCGANSFEEIYRKADVYITWRLLRCRECSLVSLSPRPTDEQVLNLYSDGEYQADMTRSADATHMERAKYQLGVLREFCSEGKVLDVGCSTGLFLNYARQCGYEAVGVDVNPTTSAYARDILDLEVFTGDLYQRKFGVGEFEAVTLWDVLEHDLDPKALLSEIRKILKRKGVLLVSCPNIEGLFPKITYRLVYKSTRRWEFPAIPYHIHEFTPESMALILQETGFSVAKFVPTSIPQRIYLDGFRHNKGDGLALSILKLSASMLYRVLFTTVYPTANLLRKGNAFVTIARKV